MVLESLFTARKIENKPLDMFILAFITTLVSIFISYIIFNEFAGLVLPFLITVSMAHIVYRIFLEEEREDVKVAKGKLKESFFERHSDVIYLLSLFFAGVLLAIFLTIVFAPQDFSKIALKQQIENIEAIETISGNFASKNILELIIVNNLKVMFFSFLLSLLFGIGCLIILAWNASILGVYLASFFKRGFLAFALVSTGIFPHLIIEIVAYFLAGMAGGILSAAIIREKFGTKAFNFVLKDSLLMLGVACLFVVLGGIVEVFL
jgi:uncharacterized membrane protein SpoIIM required for sporulation